MRTEKMFTISMMYFEVVIGWFLNLVLLKGLGGGSLSDNGDIGDLISDYGNSILGYWAPATSDIGPNIDYLREARKLPQVPSWILYSLFGVWQIPNMSKYTTRCQIYNIVKYTMQLNNKCRRQITNAAKYQIRCQAAKFHQIPPNIEFHQISMASKDQIFLTSAHMVKMCFS